MMAIRSRTSSGKPRKNKAHRIILFTLMVAVTVAVIIAFTLFRYILQPNVYTSGNQPVSVFIPTGSDFSDVKQILYSRGLIINRTSFEWVADRKNYPDMVKPGHYILTGSMNNNTLVNMLRAGEQTPVKVVFNNIRTKEELAGKISRQIEADSLSLLKCWNNTDFLKTINSSPEKVLLIFIPNTYELWWNTDACDFTERMAKEFKSFWNEERTRKAAAIPLSKGDVEILASIVEKETRNNDEKPAIAGVYINRLKKGWPLQADPTVVFASGNYSLTRVLKAHTRIESPYNTYLHTGLPPGPICLPSIASIDAVLDYQKHSYMFFCGKADMSGHHVFSRTLAEHNRNARAYQKALNKRKILN